MKWRNVDITTNKLAAKFSDEWLKLATICYGSNTVSLVTIQVQAEYITQEFSTASVFDVDMWLHIYQKMRFSFYL